MPLFEYICRRCNKEFELLVFGKERELCPYCGSDELQRVFSLFGISKSSTSSSSSSCVGCKRKSCGGCM